MKQKRQVISLIGPMGSGKTTIGKLLAKKLGWYFLDSDAYIVDRSGVDISWIFEKEGEKGFRSRESKAIKELLNKQKLVLATGGGSVIKKKNREHLQQSIVIFLNADVDVQYHRTKRNDARPLLKNDNPKKVLESLYYERLPLYKEIADIEITTGKLSPNKMVEEVMNQLEKYLN